MKNKRCIPGALGPWRFMLMVCVFSTAAYAQTSSLPVEISAVHSLEWNRAEKTYTAREKVVAIQGTSKIESDTLVAHYSENNGATNITMLKADGHVTVSSPPYIATGDHAVYDLKTGKAVLTGKVRMLEGKNWLEGTRAVVDTKSGISQLFGTGNADTDDRVRGVFYPAEQKN